MIVDTRPEEWRRPDGTIAVVTVEIHHDGTEIVPLHLDVVAQMLSDLGFERGEQP